MGVFGEDSPQLPHFPAAGEDLRKEQQSTVSFAVGDKRVPVCICTHTRVLSRPQVQTPPRSGSDLNPGCLLARKLVGKR